MMPVLVITPVFDIAVPYLVNDYLFTGLTQSNNQQDFILFRNIQGCAQTLAFYGANNTSAKAALSRAKENALGGYTMIASGFYLNVRIQKDDNVCSRSFSLCWTRSVLQITGPSQVRKN